MYYAMHHFVFFFFFKQKTAYELRISDWSSDVCSSDLLQGDFLTATFQHEALGPRGTPEDTTVLYLVTRGHSLAQSLLPAIHRFDPAEHLPQPEAEADDGKEARQDRKSVVEGKSVYIRVDLGGRRSIKKKKNKNY